MNFFNLYNPPQMPSLGSNSRHANLSCRVKHTHTHTHTGLSEYRYFLNGPDNQFDPWNLYTDGRWKPPPLSYSLTSTGTLWPMGPLSIYTQAHTQTDTIIINNFSRTQEQ
jgi:hypothetical protein